MRSLLVVVSALLMTGCMGQTSRRPPIEVWPDMDRQPKYRPQDPSDFFADRQITRLPVRGTVARGFLNEDEALTQGVTGDQYVGRNPLPVTAELMKVGQERFNIYCAPCHDRTGSGKGPVMLKELSWQATSLHDPRVMQMNDGEIFNIISHGRRSMPPYRNQIVPVDRWAIVAYVRALQRTTGRPEDMPSNMRAEVR